MQSLNYVFTETYKRFELLAKSKGYPSVKAYEDSVNEKSKSDASKLKLCRTIFTFLTYTSQVFVEVSQQMIDFIDEQIVLLDKNQAPVKTKMISVSESIKDSDLITSAVNYMFLKNVEIAPVFDSKGYATGVITFKDVAALVASGKYSKAKTVSSIVQKVRFAFCSEETPVSQIGNYNNGKPLICLAMNSENKVVGWLQV